MAKTAPDEKRDGREQATAEAAAPAAPHRRTASIETTPLAPPAAAPLAPTLTTRPAGPSPTPARAPVVTQALPAASPLGRQAAPAAETRPPVETVVATLPGRSALAAEPPKPTAPTAAKPTSTTRPGPAGAEPATVVAGVEPAARQAPVAEAGAGADPASLAIVFANNSSYFPPGVSQKLRRLVHGLAKEQSYEVVLQSSVSGLQKVVGAETAEEARRYNKWLAERRLERVRDWFDRNGAGRELTFRQDFRQGDELRQVVIEVRPAG